MLAIQNVDTLFAMPTKQRVCVLEEAVARLGGSVKAAAAGDTTPIMVHKAIADGRVRLGGTLVLWAEALEPFDLKARWALARRLAGLE
jgi:hypothetical protein